MKELLTFLKNARLEKSLKQAYLAERLGVDESTISRWETGQIEMTISQVEGYATVLEIDVFEMFAFLASDGGYRPKPIAEVLVEVYTETAYNTLTQELSKLGIDAVIKNTKLNRWK